MTFKMSLGLYLLFHGMTVVFCRTYCHTGYNDYTYCTYYCCDGFYSWSYDYCCLSSSSSNNNYDSSISAVDSWWADHVWAAVLIGLGSLGTLVGMIVCCVCCIKGCTANNRKTGAVVHNPNQAGQGVFMVTNTAGQQQPQLYHQGQVQRGYSFYPSGFVGTSDAAGQHVPTQPYPPSGGDQKETV